MTDFKSQMDQVLAANGLNVEKTFAMVNMQSLVFLLQASKSGIAQAILPEDMAKVVDENTAEEAMGRIVSDEAFVVANIRALAKYVEAKFEGKKHNISDIAQFYELYKASSDEDKVTAQIGTLRILDRLMSAEFNRVRGDEPEITDSDFEELLKAFEGQGMAGIYHNIQPVAEFVFNMGMVIFKAVELGKTVEEARDANRTVGFINDMLLKRQLQEVSGLVVEAVFKHNLPEDQFNLVEAIGEREAQRQETGDASVKH